MHDTLEKNCGKSPPSGTVIPDHTFPLHDSASRPSPTATHADRETHDTPDKMAPCGAFAAG